MRFSACAYRLEDTPFRFSFRHARAERRGVRALFVRLTTDTGRHGYGEALPRDYLTGESLESVERDLRERWWPRLRELTFPDHADTADAALAVLRPLYEDADAERRTAGYGAVDIATVDACARAWGLPGSRLFGPVAHPAPLVAALGDRGPRATRWLARLAWWAGFRHFKLKVGVAGLERDLRRAQAVWRMLGDSRSSTVYADANAAWDPATAAHHGERLFNAGWVTYLEQPLAADDATGLARIPEQAFVNIMADESLVTRADGERLIAAFSAAGTLSSLVWNLRVGKVGGFSGMHALAARARAAEVDTYLGVLVGESAVLAAAGRACLGLSPFNAVEYGFQPLLFKRRWFAPLPSGMKGVGPPLGETPGLGVEPTPSLDEAGWRKI